MTEIIFSGTSELPSLADERSNAVSNLKMNQLDETAIVTLKKEISTSEMEQLKVTGPKFINMTTYASRDRSPDDFRTYL